MMCKSPVFLLPTSCVSCQFFSVYIQKSNNKVLHLHNFTLFGAFLLFIVWLRINFSVSSKHVLHSCIKTQILQRTFRGRGKQFITCITIFELK